MLRNERKNGVIQITQDCTKIPTSFGKLVSFVPLSLRYATKRGQSKEYYFSREGIWFCVSIIGNL
jgi:hypothetical protein